MLCEVGGGVVAEVDEEFAERVGDGVREAGCK